VRSISLQRWHGAPDAGRWIHQSTLNPPNAVPKVLTARSA